jgi:DNA replication and repair protein RecF
MEIRNIRLTNFRNHIAFETSFAPGINLITGPNGTGKTNVLEAIALLSATKSYKAQYDRDMINHHKDFTRVEGTVADEGEDLELEIFIQKNPQHMNTSVKKAKVNKVARSLFNFLGRLTTVMFSPEEIDIITGSPAGRRKFIDTALYQLDPLYKKNHLEYLAAVRQRNKVLEKIAEFGRGQDEIGFWNTKIVQNGVFIQDKRKLFLDSLNEGLRGYGKILDGQDTSIDVTYIRSEVDYDRLHEYFPKEIYAKKTLIGPHREDIGVNFNGFNISGFASRGQQRTAILALKLAEIDYFTKVRDSKPVLILDDIFSELDGKHEEAVLGAIKNHQSVLTATHLPEYSVKPDIIIDLEKEMSL